jgi:starch synthase
MMQEKSICTTKKAINVLFIAAEAEPFVKVGGLGDVAGSLPLKIHKIGASLPFVGSIDIRMALPFYGEIKRQNLPLVELSRFPIITGENLIETTIYSYSHQGMTVYFIDGAPIDPDSPVYGKNFVADAEKFIFFSLACLELPRVLDWQVDVLHANDWHTAIAIHQLANSKSKDTFLAKPKTILTLHNLPFMGNGSCDALKKYGISPSIEPTLPAWAKELPLPMGLAAADRIVAVSPTYARELLTSDFGCGLDGFFVANQEKICGILNGIDQAKWDPLTDSHIKKNYSQDSIANKGINKAAIQQEMGFKVNPTIPLLIVISRMDPQKGVDIAIEGLRLCHQENWQAVFLGCGDAKLENAVKALAKDFPRKVCAQMTFDLALSHRLYAGADILLMPSRYEPCGLTQLIAMRYGCVPVAHATGGLVDTIRDHRDQPPGNGYLFYSVSAPDFAQTLKAAIDDYCKSEEWGEIMQEGMQSDYSWENSAHKYIDLYCLLTPGI